MKRNLFNIEHIIKMNKTLTTFSDDLRNFNDAVSRVTNGLKMQLMTCPSIVRGELKFGT